MNKEKELLVFAFSYIVFVFLNLLITHYEFYYDGARNENVMIEFAEHNTLTLYAFPYVNNPPIYFILGGFIIKLFGEKQIVFKIMELTLYFIAGLLVYLFLSKNKIKKTLSFFAFFLFLTDVAVIHLHNIDYVGIICLLTILALITYNNFNKKPTLKNSIIFGIVGAFSFLTKSSFLFVYLPIYFHAFFNNLNNPKKLKLIFLSGVILSLGQFLWECYLYVNHLPLIPNLAELSGNIEWSVKKTFNPFSAFLYSIKKWNVLYVLALLLVIIKRDYKSVLSYLLFLTPLLTSIVLKVYPEESMTSIMVFSIIYIFENFNFKKNMKAFLFIVFVLFVFRVFAFEKSDFVFYKNSIRYECPYFVFAENLSEHDVLLDTINYAYLNLLSPAYVDYNNLIEKKITPLLALDINYVSFFEKEKHLIEDPISVSFGIIYPENYFKQLKKFNCFCNKTNKTIYVYSFNSTSFYSDLGIKYYFDVKINNLKKNMNSQSLIQVIGNNFTATYFTNKIGEKRIFVNKPGVYHLTIIKTGYEVGEYNVFVPISGYAKIIVSNELKNTKNITLSNIIEINLTKGNAFFHNVSELRY